MNTYPPVVDRSVGAGNQPIQQGAQQQTATEANANGWNTNTLPQANQANTQVANPQVANNQIGAVVTIPPANTGAAAVDQGQPINTQGQLVNPNTVAQQQVAQGQNPQVQYSQGQTPQYQAQGVANQVANVAIAQPQPQIQGPSEDEFYSRGFELLKNSKYEEASQVFGEQLTAYPKGAQADDAHYWISEAMTMVNKTDIAKTHLKEIVDVFPQSPRVPDAKLRLAYIELRKGNQIEARILLQEIISA